MRTALRFLERQFLPLIIFGSVFVTWPILAEYELFERFYEYSRAHEEWDLDEFALLILNLTLALLVSTVMQSRKLRRALSQRDTEWQRAENNARHDPLTGLMNRRAFTELLEQIADGPEKSNGRILAMIDLDRFKPVNDLYGHAAGDATLQTIAERLQTTVGPEVQLARLGGDEFAIVFGASDTVESAERASRRILHVMEQEISFEKSQIQISCSIGLITWDTEVCPSEVMRMADKALYSAKKAGRAQFAWYDEDLDRKSHARAQIEASLRDAIRANQIEPWFQPIIEIETSRLKGFEVLARWTHEEFGEIEPRVFIPIAEDSGQIGALGMAVLHKACEVARDWAPDLSIAFNISPYQFQDPKLVEQIENILKTSGFDPQRLIVEVTESAVIHNFEVARTKLDALKALGVAIALDDFGTGYSSLASLRQLPFDRIKIDRSFVTNIREEPQNQKIVSGIMALANGLQLSVTAEGIETVSDLEFLQSLDCEQGQGFLFEHAVPAEKVAWLLQTKWGGPEHGAEPDDAAPVAMGRA